MRILVLMTLLCALAVSGCAKKKGTSGSATGAKSGKSATTEKLVNGRVGTVNTPGRFVVLEFPNGKIPAQDEKLAIYRNGVKVGEVKITNLQRGEKVVADIVSGEPEASDEVRGN